MFDPIDFDPDLAGLWPPGRARLAPYGTGLDPGADDDVDAGLDLVVHAVWIETKAAGEPSPAEQSRQLLSEMMTELKLQFVAFRSIRVDAEAKLAAGDEGEQKAAKADIKSAGDALSLIVRTLEKIDTLQRSLARDLEIAAEQDFDEAAYDRLVAETEQHIERRVAERMAALGMAGADGGACGDTGPPDPQ